MYEHELVGFAEDLNILEKHIGIVGERKEGANGATVVDSGWSSARYHFWKKSLNSSRDSTANM